MTNSHKILTVDTYSFTASGQPYPAYQIYWFAELCYFWLYQVGGLALIVFSHSLLITLAYLLLLFISNSLIHNWRLSAFCTLFAAVLGISDWNVRTQAFTFAIGVLFLLGIYSFRHQKQIRWLLVFPLGMLVWVNCHGSFVIGLALLGIWTLDELVSGIKTLRKKGGFASALKPVAYPLIGLGSCMVVMNANPSGPGIFSYVLGMMKNSVIQTLVPEWAPPVINSFEGGIFWGGFVLCLVIILFSLRHLSFFQGLSFLVFGALAIKTSRGIIWFGLIMSPILADLVSRKWMHPQDTPVQDMPASRTALNAIFAGLLVVMGVASLPWFKDYLPLPELKAGLISSETPVAGTHYLLTHPSPNPVFNDLAFGSYMIWVNRKVFVDPRLDLYSWAIWNDYIAIGQGQDNWEERLDRYGIKTLFLNPGEETHLIRLAQQSKKWSMVYHDTHSVIFVKE